MREFAQLFAFIPKVAAIHLSFSSSIEIPIKDMGKDLERKTKPTLLI